MRARTSASCRRLRAVPHATVTQIGLRCALWPILELRTVCAVLDVLPSMPTRACLKTYIHQFPSNTARSCSGQEMMRRALLDSLDIHLAGNILHYVASDAPTARGQYQKLQRCANMKST